MIRYPLVFSEYFKVAYEKNLKKKLGQIEANTRWSKIHVEKEKKMQNGYTHDEITHEK